MVCGTRIHCYRKEVLSHYKVLLYFNISTTTTHLYSKVLLQYKQTDILISAVSFSRLVSVNKELNNDRITILGVSRDIYFCSNIHSRFRIVRQFKDSIKWIHLRYTYRYCRVTIQLQSVNSYSTCVVWRIHVVHMLYWCVGKYSSVNISSFCTDSCVQSPCKYWLTLLDYHFYSWVRLSLEIQQKYICVEVTRLRLQIQIECIFVTRLRCRFQYNSVLEVTRFRE